MRTIVLAGALAVALSGSAFAQMCGGGSMMQQQSGTTAERGMVGMGGCMGMRQAQVQDDPMADKPAATTSKPMMGGGMMCPCCKNMASMGGMMGDPKPEPEQSTPQGESGQHKH